VICFNESTFVTDDLAQCLCNVLFMMRCAFGAHLDVGLAERPTTSRFIGTVHVSLPMFQVGWLSFDKTECCDFTRITTQSARNDRTPPPPQKNEPQRRHILGPLNDE